MFEGIIPNLERRYRETDSVAVKEELSKYLNQRACPDCDGTRLRREARYVKVADRTIHELSSLPLKESQPFFEKIEPGPLNALAKQTLTHERASYALVSPARAKEAPKDAPTAGPAAAPKKQD